jgi:nicotinamidase-related amidase
MLCCLSYLSGFSQKKDILEDKLLIVLDIQEYYTNNKLPEGAARQLIDSVNFVISKTSPDHVVYIKSVHKVLNLSLSYPFVYASRDTSAMCFDKRMNVVNDHIFIKEKANTFTIDELNDFIKQSKAKEIIIVGLMAEQCVYESLLGGRELGYEMYAVPQAIIGESGKSKDKVIKKLMEKGVKRLDISSLGNE